MKQKIIFDKKKSDQKKAFRIPTVRKTEVHTPKKRYTRKIKHKKGWLP